jgi:hypothetical protein
MTLDGGVTRAHQSRLVIHCGPCNVLARHLWLRLQPVICLHLVTKLVIVAKLYLEVGSGVQLPHVCAGPGGRIHAATRIAFDLITSYHGKLVCARVMRRIVLHIRVVFRGA